MTYKEKAAQELKVELRKTFKKWLEKYSISEEEVFYDDGEYGPSLADVFKHIVVDETAFEEKLYD